MREVVKPPKLPESGANLADEDLPSSMRLQLELVTSSILAELEARGRPVATVDLAAVADCTVDAACKSLYALALKNRVQKVRRGFWAAASWRPPARDLSSRDYNKRDLEVSNAD